MRTLEAKAHRKYSQSGQIIIYNSNTWTEHKRNYVQILFRIVKTHHSTLTTRKRDKAHLQFIFRWNSQNIKPEKPTNRSSYRMWEIRQTPLNESRSSQTNTVTSVYLRWTKRQRQIRQTRRNLQNKLNQMRAILHCAMWIFLFTYINEID